MKKLRILQVIDSYYPVIEGVVNVLDNYTTILNTIEGVECDALVPIYKPIVERGYTTLRCKSMRISRFGLNLPLPSMDRKLKKTARRTTLRHNTYTCTSHPRQICTKMCQETQYPYGVHISY